jgi:hypothetical protein
MNNLLEQNGIVEQLTSDLEKLQIELKQEKKLREEIEANYELLSNQYEQAIVYIQSLRRPSSNKEGAGCLFFTFITILIFTLFYFIVTGANEKL